jgi:hypothetical protein
MKKRTGDMGKLVDRGDTNEDQSLPSPSMQFRRRAWLEFQRALNPLGPPRPLPMKRPR